MTTALTRYDHARSAVQAARTVDDAKDIADKALALQMYAKQARDPEMESWVAEIRLRARRRIGELTREMEKAQGANLPNVPKLGHTAKREAIAAAGISKSEAHRCERIASVPAQAFERVIAEKREAKRAVTADDVERFVVKREKQAAPAAKAEEAKQEHCVIEDLDALCASGQRFATVYADPPWQYGNQGTRGSSNDHYVGMTVEEICALPVARLAAQDAHLHLWTTNAFLFEAKRVMEAWGFEYKSCYVWVKPQMGMGNYWRVSHEFMLFGVRGSAPFSDRSLMSWGQFPRGRHSAKPEEVRALIERASPGPRIELFARQVAPGWAAWGNEVPRAEMVPA